MTGRHTITGLVCVLALTPSLVGCRSSEPLAPKHAVDGALSNIALYCGEATALGNFGGHRDRIQQLDSAATTSAHHLIRIMRAGPESTYLGQSMREVVSTTASATAECGLSHASATLSAALGAAPSP